jgi:carbon storage regulator
MLVLSRKAHETVLIGNDMMVTVLSVRGKAVRLGITAPASVTVLRQELAPSQPSPPHSLSGASPSPARRRRRRRLAAGC